MLSRSRIARACVTVIGATGGIGQPLSMLLKQTPLVSELRLYDLQLAPGVAADLSHMSSTPSKVIGFAKDEFEKAVDGTNIVVFVAGIPRKPGMTRDDLFNINATVVATLLRQSAKLCPNALYLIITNPLNSTVPIAAEVLKKARNYAPNHLIGCTTLDVVRAKTFIGNMKGVVPSTVNVDVIGGHSGETIVPVLSRAGVASGTFVRTPFTPEETKALTHRIRFGGDEVVKAKDGAGSATLSMAYGGFDMVNALIRGLKGEMSYHVGFTESSVVPGVDYFSSPLKLGPDGVQDIPPLMPLDEYEQSLMSVAIPELQKNIKKGIEFAKAQL